MLPGSGGRASCFIGMVDERGAALLPLRVLPEGTDDKGVGKVFALAGAGRSSIGCWWSLISGSEGGMTAAGTD